MVARALEAILRHARDDRAGEVRAGLVQRHEPALVHPHQHARLRVGRIVERQRLADRELRQARDLLHGRLPAPRAPRVLAEDPDLAEGERGADEHHEAREVAPRDVLVGLHADREVPAPTRLGRPAVRRDRARFTRVPVHAFLAHVEHGEQGIEVRVARRRTPAASRRAPSCSPWSG